MKFTQSQYDAHMRRMDAANGKQPAEGPPLARGAGKLSHKPGYGPTAQNASHGVIRDSSDSIPGLVVRERSAGGGVFAVELPIRTKSEMNQGGNLRPKLARKKHHHEQIATTWTLLRAWGFLQSFVLPFPVLVRLTRIAPRRMDTDNLASAFKWIRDAIAAELGCDDGDGSCVAWAYDQERDTPLRYAVRIELLPGGSR